MPKETYDLSKVKLLRDIIRSIENQHQTLMDTLYAELTDAIEDAHKANLSFHEIGIYLGVSRQRVHQLMMRGQP